MRFAKNFEERLAALTDAEKLQAQEALQAYQQLRRWNPMLFYVPHDGQRPFHEAIQWAYVRALMGGNRSGKTTAGLCDDLIQAMPREIIPEHLMPYKKYECPFYCRIVIPDFMRHLNDVVLQKLREWTPKQMLRNGSFDTAYSKAERQLRFECGCRFDFMSFEQELDKFGGAALHRCHYDEEPPEEIREECQMRLIDFNGDELFTMTPLQGMTWMYDGILEAAQTDPEIYVEVVDMDDNPHLSDAGKRRQLKGLSEEKLEARKKGRMVHFAGMVYPRFEDARVSIPDRRFVRSLQIVVGIDPGVRCCGVAFVGFDRDNCALIFDELRLHDLGVAQVCVRIREKLKEWGIPESEVEFFIDPAAGQRTITNAVKVETSFHNEGIYSSHGQNDVEGGIAIIADRIDNNGLKIADNCVDHFWEAKRYRRKYLEESGKWTVVKENDHVMDADRYAITSRPWEVSISEFDTVKERMTRYKRDPDAAFPPAAIHGERKPDVFAI